MAKKKAVKNKRPAKVVDLPECEHMAAFHDIRMPTVAALALVSAATHAVRNGYDDGTDWLESAVNCLLESCGIDCDFEDDGTMVLTVK